MLKYYIDQKQISKSIIHIFVANNDEKKIYESTLDPKTYGKIIVGVVGMKNIRNFISNYFPENKHIFNLDDDIVELQTLTKISGKPVEIKVNQIYGMII